MINEVLNCDCIEYMKTQKDNAFDLAVVDPPYGVGSVTYMPHERLNAMGGYIDKYEVLVATLISVMLFDKAERRLTVGQTTI